MNTLTRTAVAILALTVGAAAQAPRTFEAASIKRQTMPGPGVVAVTGTRVSAPFVTMRTLVQSAYGVDRDQVVNGPGWIDTDHFEVSAKVPAGTSVADVRLMLRALLADRFGLAAHT